jgi:hypothetical protein
MPIPNKVVFEEEAKQMKKQLHEESSGFSPTEQKQRDFRKSTKTMISAADGGLRHCRSKTTLSAGTIARCLNLSSD